MVNDHIANDSHNRSEATSGADLIFSTKSVGARAIKKQHRIHAGAHLKHFWPSKNPSQGSPDRQRAKTIHLLSPLLQMHPLY